MKSPKVKPPTEEQECIALTQYLELLNLQGKVVVFTHTAQETFTRSWGIKAKNKRMGVRKGCPDYIVVTTKDVLFIEMKRIKLSRTSDEQKQWLAAINATGGKAVVCKGFSEAEKYLKENV